MTENFGWSLDRLKLIGMVHFEKGLVTKRIAHFETKLHNSLQRTGRIYMIRFPLKMKLFPDKGNSFLNACLQLFLRLFQSNSVRSYKVEQR